MVQCWQISKRLALNRPGLARHVEQICAIRTLRRLSLYREVTVMDLLDKDMLPYEVANTVQKILSEKGIVQKGDTIVITRGSTMGKSGSSDTMQIRKVM